MVYEDIQITRLDITDIDDKQYDDVSVDFANQHLLNRVKVLSVFFGEGISTFVWSYEAVKACEIKAPIFFEELSKFLFKTTKRIGTIKIIEMPDLVGNMPEYLRFLSSSMTIANCIVGKGVFFYDEIIACFMAGLCHVDGPKKFLANFEWTRNDMRMLFLGIGASPSLEHLEIKDIEFYDGPSMPNVSSIIKALRQNRSLKCLSIDLPEDFDPSAMLEAALQHPNLDTLKMKLSDGSINDMTEQHSWEVLSTGLFHTDCTLKEIRLDGFSFPKEIATVSQGSATTIPCNKSAKSLALVNTGQTLQTLLRVARSFKSVTHLDLSGCIVDDLSHLDELLLSEMASLESLCLSHCQIGAESMMEFVRKLGQMKTLKILIMDGNPFTQSEFCVGALKVALWKNTSLEFVSLGGNLPAAIAEKMNLPRNGNERPNIVREWLAGRAIVELSSFDMLPTHLNRAGRGSLLENVHGLTANQLLKILERAGKLQYYTCREEEVVMDVTFWLLRNMMITQLSS